MKTWTTSTVRATKGTSRLACLTAYDCGTARLLDEAGIPLILVGDSLGMALLGYDSTLPVTMEEMLHHTRAVTRGVKAALVVADMPFMSYQGEEVRALENAGRFLKEAGADAVKIEGGAFRAPLVRSMVANGIAVLGHIGLTPQNVRERGGYKVQGRSKESAESLIEDALALEAAGVFALVIECVPGALARRITEAVTIPTIGIGAGTYCDGQILVIQDMLGLPGGRQPRFVKRYANLADTMLDAVRRYGEDVRQGTFPQPEHTYGET